MANPLISNDFRKTSLAMHAPRSLSAALLALAPLAASAPAHGQSAAPTATLPAISVTGQADPEQSYNPPASTSCLLYTSDAADE